MQQLKMKRTYWLVLWQTTASRVSTRSGQKATGTASFSRQTATGYEGCRAKLASECCVASSSQTYEAGPAKSLAAELTGFAITAAGGWENPWAQRAYEGLNLLSTALEGVNLIYGGIKLSNPQKLAAQMQKRGWTMKQVGEAMKTKGIPAMGKKGPAIRYVHPQTGKSVVVDKKTGEVFHVGGEGFKY